MIGQGAGFWLKVLLTWLSLCKQDWRALALHYAQEQSKVGLGQISRDEELFSVGSNATQPGLYAIGGRYVRLKDKKYTKGRSHYLYTALLFSS